MKNIVAKEYLAYKEAFSGVMSPKEVPAYFLVKRILSYRFKKIGMSFKYI